MVLEAIVSLTQICDFEGDEARSVFEGVEILLRTRVGSFPTAFLESIEALI